MKNITKLTIAILIALVLAMNVSAITGNNSNNYTHVGIINSIEANANTTNIDSRITAGPHPINIGNNSNTESRFGIFDINRAPNVTNITSPINNITITATSTLLNFTPEDRDNNTMKCYVYANSTSSTTLTLINTTSNIKNGTQVQVNYSGLSSATYNWYAQCEDDALNSSLSSPGEFTIVTEEEEEEEPTPEPSPGSSSAPAGGGGGGAASVPITTFDISKTTIHESIKQGQSTTVEVTIANRGFTSIPITIDYSDLKSNLLIDETSFILKAKEEKTIKLTFFASETDEPQIIPGRIKVSSPLITKTINTIIEIKSKFALFDILTTVNDKVLTTKDNVNFTSKITNMGDLYPVDVTLRYEIRTFENETLIYKEDTFAVYKEINVTRELEIPDYLKDGEYILATELIYKGEKAVSSDIFEIQERIDLPISTVYIKVILWWLLILIILLIIIKKLHEHRKQITHKEITIAITIILAIIVITLTYINYDRLVDILSNIVNLDLIISTLKDIIKISFALTSVIIAIILLYKRNKYIKEGLNIIYKQRLLKTPFETIRKILIRKGYKRKQIQNMLNIYFQKSEVKFKQEHKLMSIISKRRARGEIDKKIEKFLRLDGWDMELVKKVLNY